jgi:hypothetical protein
MKRGSPFILSPLPALRGMYTTNKRLHTHLPSGTDFHVLLLVETVFRYMVGTSEINIHYTSNLAIPMRGTSRNKYYYHHGRM